MNKIRHSREFEIKRGIDEVFPLFSAEGEKSWVPDWDYENIMGTTELCEDYIFLTENHDHGSGNAIWLVKKFEPKNYFVQFYKVEPKDKVGIITVQCFQKEEIKTTVKVTYEYIAISEKGAGFIKDFDKNAYEKFINEWETLLDKYFSQLR